MPLHPILRKLHVLGMPLYDWKNHPISEQVSTYYQKLKKQRRFSAFLVLAKMAFLFILNLAFYIVGVLFSLGKYRLLTVDLGQFGTAFYLDVKIKELLLNNPGLKFIVPINPYWEMNNKILINMYRPHVIFAESIIAKLLLCPFYYNRFITFNTKNIDGTDSEAHLVFSQFQQTIDPKPLITLSDKEKSYCREALSDYGIEKDFVVLHVRDSGYYQERWNSIRNADIGNYFEAIQYLIHQDYRVVRIGAKNSISPDKRFSLLEPDFFDYPKSPIKSELMDIYLISHAAFFIGTASGPSAVATIFNIPSLTTNHVSPGDAFHLLKNDFSIFKKWVHKDGYNVNLHHLFSRQLRHNPSFETLDNMDLTIIDNTASEILEAAKEFCARLAEPSIPTPLNDQLRATIDLFSNKPIWRPGKFCESFLANYIENQRPF